MSRDTFADIQPTKAIIYVDDKPLNFVSMRLEQAFGEHHSFVIKADFDALGQDFMNNPIEHLRLIGRTVDIDIQQGTDSANITIGEKPTQATGKTDLFTDNGDFVVKSAGKALVQGVEDARISKG